MKVQIVGHSIKEGISKKTNKPYSMGEIHSLVPFSARDIGTSGFSVAVQRVDPVHLKKIAHLPLPLDVELEVQDVMLYGKPEREIIEIRPIGIAKASPVPLQKAA